MKAFYRDASACVKVKGEMGECFKIKAGLRQGCVMSPWLFNIFMNGVIREMKAKIGNLGIDNAKWKFSNHVHYTRFLHYMIPSGTHPSHTRKSRNTCIVDDTVLLAEREKDLQK